MGIGTLRRHRNYETRQLVRSELTRSELEAALAEERAKVAQLHAELAAERAKPEAPKPVPLENVVESEPQAAPVESEPEAQPVVAKPSRKR